MPKPITRNLTAHRVEIFGPKVDPDAAEADSGSEAELPALEEIVKAWFAELKAVTDRHVPPLKLDEKTKKWIPAPEGRHCHFVDGYQKGPGGKGAFFTIYHYVSGRKALVSKLDESGSFAGEVPAVVLGDDGKPKDMLSRMEVLVWNRVAIFECGAGFGAFHPVEVCLRQLGKKVSVGKSPMPKLKAYALMSNKARKRILKGPVKKTRVVGFSGYESNDNILARALTAVNSVRLTKRGSLELAMEDDRVDEAFLKEADEVAEDEGVTVAFLVGNQMIGLEEMAAKEACRYDDTELSGFPSTTAVRISMQIFLSKLVKDEVITDEGVAAT